MGSNLIWVKQRFFLGQNLSGLAFIVSVAMRSNFNFVAFVKTVNDFFQLYRNEKNYESYD